MKFVYTLFWMTVGFLSFAVLMFCSLLIDFFKWTRGYFESHWVSCCICGGNEMATAHPDNEFVCFECNRKGFG